MKTKTEKTATFVAIDASGNNHIIDIYTTFTEFNPASGSAQWVAGAKEYKMQNGNHINLHSDGTLEDFVTGMKMRRI